MAFIFATSVVDGVAPSSRSMAFVALRASTTSTVTFVAIGTAFRHRFLCNGLGHIEREHFGREATARRRWSKKSAAAAARTANVVSFMLVLYSAESHYNSSRSKRMNRRRAITQPLLHGVAAAATVSVASAADKEIDVFTDHWRKSKTFTLKVAEADAAGELRLQAVRRRPPVRW